MLLLFIYFVVIFKSDYRDFIQFKTLFDFLFDLMFFRIGSIPVIELLKIAFKYNHDTFTLISLLFNLIIVVIFFYH